MVKSSGRAKVVKRCKRCADLSKELNKRDIIVQVQGEQIRNLRAEVEVEKKKTFEQLEHLKARTELMKALSWAMKTCSSALWSDRKNQWMPDDRRLP